MDYLMEQVTDSGDYIALIVPFKSANVNYLEIEAMLNKLGLINGEFVIDRVLFEKDEFLRFQVVEIRSGKVQFNKIHNRRFGKNDLMRSNSSRMIYYNQEILKNFEDGERTLAILSAGLTL